MLCVCICLVNIYIYIHAYMYMYIYAHKYYIYTHIRIYTCIYIYVYIYIYAFLFNMLETVVWGQSKFFPIYSRFSEWFLEICLSFFAIFSFYRMRRGYNRTRNPIDSVFIILSFTFYLFFFFFFFCIVHYIIIMSFFRRFTVYYRIVLRQRSFSKYRMQIISMNRNILFSLLHYFPSLRIVLRLAKTKKKKRKKVVHAQI